MTAALDFRDYYAQTLATERAGYRDAYLTSLERYIAKRQADKAPTSNLERRLAQLQAEKDETG